MNVQDFLELSDWDDLPDNPEEAFARVVRIVQAPASRELERLRNLAEQTESYSALLDAQFNYMNSMIGLAKGFEVPLFATYEIPNPYDFDERTFRGFQADISHFTAQVQGRSVRRNQQLSVSFEGRSDDAVRGYLHHLKLAVDKAGISEAKKRDLHDRLIQFETILNGKRRLNIMEVTLFAMEIMAIPGGLWATGEVGSALAHKLIQAVAEQKAQSAERAAIQSSSNKPLSISAPSHSARQQTHDLNDDIPF